jgi:hypothetical protein
MMDSALNGQLKGLGADVVRHVDVPFRLGSSSVDLAAFVQDLDFDAESELSTIETILDEGMKKYAGKPAQSDTWIGPRLHAGLRLTRRQAADRSLWRYLAIGSFPEYVRWRWSTETDESEPIPPALDRFVGPDYKHALARLWWMAEIFRNGADYGPARRALAIQDIANNLFRMDIAHHRPTPWRRPPTLPRRRSPSTCSPRMNDSMTLRARPG